MPPLLATPGVANGRLVSCLLVSRSTALAFLGKKMNFAGALNQIGLMPWTISSVVLHLHSIKRPLGAWRYPDLQSTWRNRSSIGFLPVGGQWESCKNAELNNCGMVYVWLFSWFSHLGGGFFCYMYHTAMWREDKSDLTLVTFKVSRIVGGAVEADGHHDAKFLTCKVIGKFTKKIKLLGTCCPTYSFIL